MAKATLDGAASVAAAKAAHVTQADKDATSSQERSTYSVTQVQSHAPAQAVKASTTVTKEINPSGVHSAATTLGHAPVQSSGVYSLTSGSTHLKPRYYRS